PGQVHARPEEGARARADGRGRAEDRTQPAEAAASFQARRRGSLRECFHKASKGTRQILPLLCTASQVRRDRTAGPRCSLAGRCARLGATENIGPPQAVSTVRACGYAGDNAPEAYNGNEETGSLWEVARKRAVE